MHQESEMAKPHWCQIRAFQEENEESSLFFQGLTIQKDAVGHLRNALIVHIIIGLSNVRSSIGPFLLREEYTSQPTFHLEENTSTELTKQATETEFYSVIVSDKTVITLCSARIIRKTHNTAKQRIHPYLV